MAVRSDHTRYVHKARISRQKGTDPTRKKPEGLSCSSGFLLKDKVLGVDLVLMFGGAAATENRS